ncbi:MAG: hypothetical protein M0Z28_33045, partial [Rhodospirillales bacterium]|nr:hypothetical protein [Rhodospirillales bacterium]
MSGSSSGSTTSNAGSNTLAQAIASVVTAGSAVIQASAPGAAFAWTPGATFPSVPAGQLGRVGFAGPVTGTAALPAQYNIVTDSATAPVMIIANGSSPQLATITGTGQTYNANGASGYFVSGNATATASPTGTGAGVTGTTSPTGTGAGVTGTTSPTGTSAGVAG